MAYIKGKLFVYQTWSVLRLLYYWKDSGSSGTLVQQTQQ